MQRVIGLLFMQMLLLLLQHVCEELSKHAHYLHLTAEYCFCMLQSSNTSRLEVICGLFAHAVIFKHLRGSGKGSEASPAAQMAAHIARIAG